MLRQKNWACYMPIQHNRYCQRSLSTMTQSASWDWWHSWRGKSELLIFAFTLRGLHVAYSTEGMDLPGTLWLLRPLSFFLSFLQHSCVWVDQLLESRALLVVTTLVEYAEQVRGIINIEFQLSAIISSKPMNRSEMKLFEARLILC